MNYSIILTKIAQVDFSVIFPLTHCSFPYFHRIFKGILSLLSSSISSDVLLS